MICLSQEMQECRGASFCKALIVNVYILSLLVILLPSATGDAMLHALIILFH